MKTIEILQDPVADFIATKAMLAFSKNNLISEKDLFNEMKRIKNYDDKFIFILNNLSDEFNNFILSSIKKIDNEYNLNELIENFEAPKDREAYSGSFTIYLMFYIMNCVESKDMLKVW